MMQDHLSEETALRTNAAPDGDAEVELLKCSLGRTLDKVGTNSVSKPGRGTGVGAPVYAFLMKEKEEKTAHGAGSGVYWCGHVCGGKSNAGG